MHISEYNIIPVEQIKHINEWFGTLQADIIYIYVYSSIQLKFCTWRMIMFALYIITVLLSYRQDCCHPVVDDVNEVKMENENN